MPDRELSTGTQVEEWLRELSLKLAQPATLTLIGSGALLWHAAQRGLTTPLPSNSMDIDPITDSDEVAIHCYDAHIGSDFEKTRGWHVNLMPKNALAGLPPGWEERKSSRSYGALTVVVPAPVDLLVPKLRRGEPRDLAHAQWAAATGLCPAPSAS